MNRCVQSHRLTQVCADCAAEELRELLDAVSVIVDRLPKCHIPGCGKPYLRYASGEAYLFADDEPEQFCDEHAPEASADFGDGHPDKPGARLREALAVYDRYRTKRSPAPVPGGTGTIPTVWDRLMNRTPVPPSTPKIVQDRSTPERRAFWESVEQVAAAVREWPDWKRRW